MSGDRIAHTERGLTDMTKTAPNGGLPEAARAGFPPTVLPASAGASTSRKPAREQVESKPVRTKAGKAREARG